MQLRAPRPCAPLLTKRVQLSCKLSSHAKDSGDLRIFKGIGKHFSVTREAQLWQCWGHSEQYSRYLEGTSAQDSGSLVLGHVGGRDPLLVCLLPLSRGQNLHVLLSLLVETDPRSCSAAPATEALRCRGSP